MRNPKFGALLGLIGFGFGALLLSSGHAGAQNGGGHTSDVNVVNTPNVNVSSLPAVQLSGTPNVNVANTPAVSISGTPTVHVGSMPTVNAAQSGAWNVGVTGQVDLTRGGPSAPMIVRDGTSVQPYMDTTSVSLDEGTDLQSVRFANVPAGKRLVIEHVNIMGEIPTGQRFRFQVNTLKNDSSGNPIVSGTWGYAPIFMGTITSGANDVYSADHEAKFYLEHVTGGSLSLVLSRGSFSGVAEATFSFSGYLVDIP